MMIFVRDTVRTLENLDSCWDPALPKVVRDVGDSRLRVPGQDVTWSLHLQECTEIGAEAHADILSYARYRIKASSHRYGSLEREYRNGHHCNTARGTTRSTSSKQEQKRSILGTPRQAT